MANPATAIFRQIKYKQEVTYGTIPALSGSTLIRRVEFSPDLQKDTYQSNEVRTDQQIADFRHGARRVQGTLRGEMSPKAYADFYAALFRKDFVAGVTASGVGLTISGSSAPYTVLRAAGSYLTDGFKVGDVVRFSVGTLNASNIAKNLLITSMADATHITVLPVNGSTMVAEGPITGCTITVVGKKTFVPTSGHTDKSFSVESWFNDLGQSEMFAGMKPRVARFALPSTGMATTEIEFGGQNISTNASEQFTAPTPAPAFGIAAAVNGILRVGSAQMLTVRDLSIAVNGNITSSPVVGSNFEPFQFAGRVVVDGQFTAYFDSITNRDAFINETELALVVVLSSDNTATSDFIGITLPRIKLGSGTKNDAVDGIVQTFSFQALLNSLGGTGTSGEQSTIVMQDTQA